MLEHVLHDIDESHEISLTALREFLTIPSISTSPERKEDCRRCAEWIGAKLKTIGFSAELRHTPGHPVVLAKNDHQPGRPTVLVYGHYDVQPPEPMEPWISPPFTPTVRKTPDGYDAIYARGAVDDKGQTWAHVHALACWQQHGGVPVNITFIIEGEEEVGSPNLAPFIAAHKDELKCDMAVVSDTQQFARGIPAITYGLRGLVYMEVSVTAADHDLHSGLYGGAVPNPANILCEILATLHDSAGKVTIENFYDDVIPLTTAERAEWKKLPFDEAKFLADLKLQSGFGESGYSTIERKWARPTCDINGLTSGYQGPGAKTIIPSTASAKVSMRLVPDQNPQKIAAAFERHIRDHAPAGVKVEVHAHSSAPPALVRTDGPAMRAALKALEIGFGQKPTLMREGGSIPIVSTFKTLLGVDTLLVGFGLPDDRIHSPNEKFDLDALFKGTRTVAALYQELSSLSSM
jgi:acetylornithine deacetylase/succinyl-diaminopimelate desuccinylase-like protein